MDFDLTAFLKLKGWKQGDLARELGMSVATVSAWNTGRRIPQYDELLKLIDIGMPYELMFGADRWEALKKSRSSELRESFLTPEECAEIVELGLRLRSQRNEEHAEK